VTNRNTQPFASFYKRALAHNTDLVFILPVLYGISRFIDNNSIFIACCLLTYILYHIFFELLYNGATPGKKILKIRVIAESEKGNIVLRNLFKILSIIPFFTGFTWALFDKKKQTLHDKLSHCVVIEDF
jgi:uncharacterized RDD family membrane protein YckC